MAPAVALALATAVAAAAAPAAIAAPHHPRTATLWRTDGYGTILALTEDGLQEYQTTAVSCIKGDFAERTGPWTYTADGSVLTVRSGSDGEHATLAADSSVGHRQLHRIAALPAACAHPLPADDPRAAFDVFWQSFEENYPFFAAKGINWQAVRDCYRSQVHADTTRDQMFALFSKIVEPLRDAHVVVQDGDRYYGVGRPGTEIPSEELDDKVRKFVIARDLKGASPVQEFADGLITYADLPDTSRPGKGDTGTLGYLRIASFSGYNPHDHSYAADLTELDRALTAVLTPDRTRHLRGLIIDLRVNGGGADSLGIHIAERLTDTPYVAYAKRARNDSADPTRFTRPEPIRVTPARAPRYTGPIAVLTGGSTVSAGETFTQALIDRPGRTVRIGQATQGVFSDTMARRLPNGMVAWLPNEEFLTRTGRTFDGTGIPPQLTEPVFTKEEFAKNRDSAFDRAVNVLGRS
ncbi:S41 family peptidase [Streptomyces sp. NPDC092369]|uniref:S41 family peptidase n=1 Tax=Streptomyces sp. NPDC092369 TaxID=3366015 RepID=UPI0038043E0A